jgi:hypothetical protein
VSASDERKLLEALRAVRESVEQEPVPQRVEDELRMAFRREMKSRKPALMSMPKTRTRWARFSWQIAAAAACVAVLAGVSLWRMGIEQPATTAVVKRSGEKPVVTERAEAAVAMPSEGEAPKPLPARVAAKRRAIRQGQVVASRSAVKSRDEVPRPVTAETELESEPLTGRPQTALMTEFVAVPYAPPFAPSDRGQLIRLQVPRQAMRRFGFPVNIERWSDRVEADVLMGEDGIARAVRFVK